MVSFARLVEDLVFCHCQLRAANDFNKFIALPDQAALVRCEAVRVDFGTSLATCCFLYPR